MANERRKYLRILFEETIQVQTEDWTDPMATGLDISLNGTRFHCEYSLTEGMEVQIMFKPDLILEGEVRWCWPIEWYYQAAIEFSKITPEIKTQLLDYIEEISGEPYPEYLETEAPPTSASEEMETFEEDTQDFELEDEEIFEDIPEISIGDDLPQSARMYATDLTPLVFANKQIVIVDEDTARAETMRHYLTERNQFSVETTNEQSHLWDLIKNGPADLVLLSWAIDGENGREILQNIQERFPGTPVIVLGGTLSLEERLEGLNEGAIDFLTRPISLSSISQCILKAFADAELV